MTCGIPVLVSSKHHRHRVFEFRDLRHRLSSPLILLADRVGQIHTLHKPVRCQVSVLGATKMLKPCPLPRPPATLAIAYEHGCRGELIIAQEVAALEVHLMALITTRVAVEVPTWARRNLGSTMTVSTGVQDAIPLEVTMVTHHTNNVRAATGRSNPVGDFVYLVESTQIMDGPLCKTW